MTFAAGAVLHLALAMLERTGTHPTDNAKQATAFMTAVRIGPLQAYRDSGLAILAALILLAFVPAIVFVPALAGLYLYEHAFIRAGQLPPLS